MRLWHTKLIPHLPRQQLLGQHREYTASALGKAICTCCGAEIHEHCRCPIFNDDIKDLATRRYSKMDIGNFVQ